MGQAGPLRGGKRAACLCGFLLEEPGGLGGVAETGFDLRAVEDAAGDEAVEADAGLVEGVVAGASGCGGNGGEFPLQDLAAVGVAGRLVPEVVVLGPFRLGWQDEAFQFRRQRWEL
jgi:hypothetical protein